MTAALDLSIVVPVFNSCRTLPELARRLRGVLSREAISYEIIYVDDASSDGSWRVLERLRDSDPGRVRAIRLPANAGQHAALLEGMRRCAGNLVATMDDDLQDRPEEIPALLRAMKTDPAADAAVGVPMGRPYGAVRLAASRLVHRLQPKRYRGTEIHGFNLIRRRLVDRLVDERPPVIGQAIAARAARLVRVPVRRDRAALPSRYGWRASLAMAWKMVAPRT
jgi:polyisoprenyl-phosphate glycosyltransferase